MIDTAISNRLTGYQRNLDAVVMKMNVFHWHLAMIKVGEFN
jgi:hypothetical protein